MTSQIARRAYELYEQRGRREGHALQDWLQAEREVHERAETNQSKARGQCR